MTDFERGAEAMREAVAKGLEDRYGYGWGSFIATVRSTPLPVQPPGSESREARLEKALRNLVWLVEKGIGGPSNTWGSVEVRAANAALAPDAHPSPSSEKQRGDKT